MKRPQLGDVVRSRGGLHWYREERCGTDARRAVYAVRSVEKPWLQNAFRSDEITFVTRSFWGDGLEAYFSVADETWNPDGREDACTLDDLDRTSVEEARCFAADSGLSWPPYLPEAEEYALRRQRERSV